MSLLTLEGGNFKPSLRDWERQPEDIGALVRIPGLHVHQVVEELAESRELWDKTQVNQG